MVAKNMAEITVEQLAKVVGIPTRQLLEKLNKAGIDLHDAGQVVTDQQRQLFLRYLKNDTIIKKAETSSSKNSVLRASGGSRKNSGLSAGSANGINVTVIRKRVHYNSSNVDSEKCSDHTDNVGIDSSEVGIEQSDRTLHENVDVDASKISERVRELEIGQEQGDVVKIDDDLKVVDQDTSADPNQVTMTRECAQLGSSDKQDVKNQSSKQTMRETGGDTVAMVTDAMVTDGEANEHKEKSKSRNGKGSMNVDSQGYSDDSINDEDETTAAVLARSGSKGKEFVTSDNKKHRDTPHKDKVRKKVTGVSSNNSKDRNRSKSRFVSEDEDRTSGVDKNSFKNSVNKRKNDRASDRVSASGSANGSVKRDSMVSTVINVPESLTVAELSQKMSLKATEVIKSMMKMGIMATINQILDQDTAALVASELGYQVNLVRDVILDDTLVLEERQDIVKLPRAPVVTIMGHVDHGKTSLLDYIRRTKVAAKEVGGITQHIGAYRVVTDRGVITFLDTPGHEAFTAMRARGAQCTDIVVLVVAADDGVMPQTIEAIQHAHAAKVPIVVAVNKIDKPGADPEKIKAELANHQVVSEEWGGDVIFQNISAKRGDGIDELLESILIVAEMQQLVAPVDCAAKGVVLEAHLDKGHGPVASMLVQEGTLRQGDIVLAGLYFGKVRAMFNDTGSKLSSATPSVPVEILGMSGVPSAGDDFFVLPSEKKAREVSMFRQSKYRDAKLAKQQASKMENILARMKENGGSKEEIRSLNVVLKADLQGSVEAITEALNRLCIDNVRVSVVASGVGGITSSDINLALASNGVVIGFNVRADNSARLLADSEGVDLRYYGIIYQLLDDIKNAMTGLLAPKYEEQILGLAEVREVFRSSKFGTVAGCKVMDGMVKRGGNVRLLRSQVVIYEGEIESIRRFKEDVNEVRQGMECGIGIKGYSDLKVGDQIEMFKKVLIKRTAG